MRQTALAAATLALTAGSAAAGGLDRSGQGINLIFEKGTVVHLGLTYVSPDVTGVSTFNGSSSGNATDSYYLPSFGYKQTVNDRIDVAILYDRPFGADIGYASGYFLSSFPPGSDDSGSLRAEADTHALTAILRYKLDRGFSVYGGLRAQTLKTEITVPAAGNYRLSSDTPVDFGYLVGVAWERHDIRARVALTYNSKVKHKLDVTENSAIPPFPGSGVARVESPQSVNLDFQTGLPPKFLLFGSIRWADWTEVQLVPGRYPAGTPTGTLVSYDNDSWTYNLGLGYAFTDNFSGALVFGYEDSHDDPVSDLSPTDGFKSIGIGGTYTLDKTKYSLGLRYFDIGDARTRNGGVFEDNDGWAIGFQLTHEL